MKKYENNGVGSVNMDSMGTSPYSQSLNTIKYWAKYPLKIGFVLTLLFSIWLVSSTQIKAADLEISIKNAPLQGTIILMIFDSPNSFGDLRTPVQKQSFQIKGNGTIKLKGLSAGEYAYVLFHDTNLNGFLDKNFIGIPKEPLAFSNNYQPKGPPSYEKAAFKVGIDDELKFTVSLYGALGKKGKWGVGMGVIGRSSPYRDYSGNVSQIIPAFTYRSKRFLIYGPQMQVGILGSKNLRLAASLRYRMGVYEEADSDFLLGMEDRKSTLMGGLTLKAETLGGVGLSLSYEADVLNKIGGYEGQFQIQKRFQWGLLGISPNLNLHWQSSELSNHDFGVPPEKANTERIAFQLQDTIGKELGLSASLEISENWFIFLSTNYEWLDGEVRTSPLVESNHVLKGVFVINYLF